MNLQTLRIACLGCTKCQLLPADIREALSADKPISYQHKSPRFGDREKDITLDGLNVADSSSDALIGAQGWILRFHVMENASPNNPFHKCPFCSQEPCMYVSRGKVEVPSKQVKIPSILDDPEDVAVIRRMFHHG